MTERERTNLLPRRVRLSTQWHHSEDTFRPSLVRTTDQWQGSVRTVFKGMRGARGWRLHPQNGCEIARALGCPFKINGRINSKGVAGFGETMNAVVPRALSKLYRVSHRLLQRLAFARNVATTTKTTRMSRTMTTVKRRPDTSGHPRARGRRRTMPSVRTIA